MEVKTAVMEVIEVPDAQPTPCPRPGEICNIVLIFEGYFVLVLLRGISLSSSHLKGSLSTSGKGFVFTLSGSDILVHVIGGYLVLINL